MSVFPFGGPVVELGGSTPCRPSVLLAGAYCGAVRPGLRISAVSPAGLGFELDPSQTRTEAENQKPAVPSRTGGRPPPPPTQQPSYLGAGPISPHGGNRAGHSGLCRLVAHLAGCTSATGS